eukprot:TRINITY_DN21801_c0_g1_i1.p1 TRINITY_DN21801_c0_g1~~TRINITY_DN21801_c0_g1_i1.p1  ORF type:complete len:214 (+),score=72.23 TRINITY_DN21801_c0_g1_i1:74-643(+)
MALSDRWWCLMRDDHSVLGITHYDGTRFDLPGTPDPFNRIERCLALGMGLGCAWVSTYCKAVCKEERGKRVAVPQGLAKLVDALFGAVGAFALNLVIGKQLIKYVLRKDWDQRGGAKGIAATFAQIWAILVTLGALAHMGSVYTQREAEEEGSGRGILAKCGQSWAAKLLVVEPAVLGLKVVLAHIAGK